MNFFTDDSLKYYNLGQFLAQTILGGIINTDMQLENIGYLNGYFKFIDYANIKKINIPDCLSADTCQIFTNVLFAVIEDIKDSFAKLSNFRMGFIAMGGLLGHAIFLNMTNSGISSSWYIKCDFPLSSYDPSFLYSDPKSKLLIRNWKKQPFEQITPLKYNALIDYEHSETRSRIRNGNRQYLDILYYSRSYTWWGRILQDIFPSDDNIEQNTVTLRYNIFSFDLNCNFFIERMAETALYSKHYYTAYGLFNKCLSEINIVDEIRELSQNGLSSILKSTDMNSSICNFIMENINRDLFEFMWILDDLDHNKTISI